MVNTHQAFRASRLKIERAYEHINDLDREVAAFFGSNSYEITVQDYASLQERALVVKRHKSIPDRFGLVVGDAAHNLRTALDLMTWEIISPLKPHPASSIQFPVGTSRDHYLKQMIPSRKINTAHPQIAEAFKDIEIYPGGQGDIICSLHSLDVLDKHQILTPTASVAFMQVFGPETIDPGFGGQTLIGGPGAKFKFTNLERDTEAKLLIWPLSGQSTPIKEVRRRLKEENQRAKTLAIAFGAEPETLSDHLVVPTLLEMAGHVTRTIDALAEAIDRIRLEETHGSIT